MISSRVTVQQHPIFERSARLEGTDFKSVPDYAAPGRLSESGALLNGYSVGGGAPSCLPGERLPGRQPRSCRGSGLRAVIVFLFLAVCLAAAPLRAETGEPWEITADRIEHLKKPETITAEGEVVLLRRRPGMAPLEIHADWMRYHVEDNTVLAKGGVKLVADRETLEAEEAFVEIDSRTGTTRKTTMFVPENNLHFQGEVVEKTGEVTYRFIDGWVSACPLPDDGSSPAWRIHSAETDLRVDGYALLKHASLRIKDIPVLYTPYLILPAKTKRETGLLFPEFTNSRRDGAGALVPIFVNLTPSADLTLYPGYLDRRGGMLGAEFRYVADSRSRGTFRASFLDDSFKDTPDDDYRGDGYLRETRARYWLRGKADHAFAENVFFRYDLDLSSDRDFIQEYRDGMIGYDQDNALAVRDFHRDFLDPSIPFRQSSLQFGKRFPDKFLGVEAVAVRDVWDAPVAVTPLQELPRVHFSGVQPLPAALPVSLFWKGDYVNYWRDTGIGGHRLDLAPNLATRLPLGPYLENSVGVGLRETLYQVEPYGDADWSADRFQDRDLWNFDASLGTALVRQFDVDADRSLTHAFRPEIGYAFQTDREQTELPRLDAVDRVDRANLLAYGVSNYFDWNEPDEEGILSRRTYGTWKLHQLYDLHEARREEDGTFRHPFSDLRSELDFYPREDISLQYDTTWSVHGQGVTRYDFIAGYSEAGRDSLSVVYGYRRNPDQEYPFFFTPLTTDSLHTLTGAATKYLLDDRLRADLSLTRSLHDDRTVRSAVRLVYAPTCWSMELNLATTEDDTRLSVQFNLAGLGQVAGLGFTSW